MAMTLQEAKSSVQTSSGLDLIAGLWLIVSPFILAYSSISSALWNDVIVGAAIVILAGRRVGGEGYRVSWPSWVNFVLGLWLILSPAVLGYSFATTAQRNSLITGIVVAVLAAWSALSTPIREEDKA